MSTPAKGLIVLLLLFGIVGIALTYDAIGRMKNKAVPPFNEGLYTAVWSIPIPPREVILFCDSLLGRIGAWGSALVVPVLFAYFLVRRGWLIVAFLLLFVWSLVSGGFGIWSWTFSLLGK